MLDRSTILRTLTAGLLCIAVGCNGDDPAGPANTELFRWSFGSDLEGWLVGENDVGGWGDVDVVNAERRDDPPDEEDGSVRLDGTGDPGEPNAWIHRSIALPADARTLAYWAAGHNRNGGDAALRVRLVDGGGASHTLADWEEFTGSEGVHNWESRSVSIAAYAGQTVTLYFEQDDNGPGSHEQIYLDDIQILGN